MRTIVVKPPAQINALRHPRTLYHNIVPPRRERAGFEMLDGYRFFQDGQPLTQFHQPGRNCLVMAFALRVAV